MGYKNDKEMEKHKKRMDKELKQRQKDAERRKIKDEKKRIKVQLFVLLYIVLCQVYSIVMTDIK